MQGSSPHSSSSSHSSAPTPTPPQAQAQAQSKMSEHELVILAYRMMDARITRDIPTARSTTEAILKEFGLTVEDIYRHTSSALCDLARKHGGQFDREILASAIASVSLSRAGYANNQFGHQAFFLAEHCLALNPHNPHMLHLLWSHFNKNREEGPVSYDRGELDREFVVIIEALENCLFDGFKIARSSFESPRGWTSHRTQWQKFAGFALENCASLLVSRSLEIRRTKLDCLTEVIDMQTRAEGMARAALTLLDVDSTDTGLGALMGGGEARGWAKIDKVNITRVARLFHTLGRIEEERKGKGKDIRQKNALLQARYSALKTIADGKARLYLDGRGSMDSHNDTASAWLTRDPLGLPNPEIEKVKSGEQSASVSGSVELKKKSPPPAQNGAVKSEVPRSEASRRDAPASNPSAWSGVSRGQEEQPAMPGRPRGAETWDSYWHSIQNAALEKVSLEAMKALARGVEVAKLPRDIEESKVTGALNRSACYAAGLLLRVPGKRPDDVAKLFIPHCKAAMEKAESELSFESALDLLALQAGLRVFNDKQSGGCEQVQKTEIKRLLPTMLVKAQEVVETIGMENGWSKITTLFNNSIR